MKINLLVFLILITLTVEDGLEIEAPGTLYISDMNFKQKVECKN